MFFEPLAIICAGKGIVFMVAMFSGTMKYFDIMVQDIMKSVEAFLRSNSETELPLQLSTLLQEKTETLIKGYSCFPCVPGMVPAIFEDLQDSSQVEAIDLT